MLSEPPMGAAILTPVVPAPVPLSGPEMNTLPLIGAVIDRPVELSPATPTEPSSCRSPCKAASSAMPKELLPWTLIEEPEEIWRVPIRGAAPARWTP